MKDAGIADNQVGNAFTSMLVKNFSKNKEEIKEKKD